MTPVSSWAPPLRDAEAGDDLVEDEQGAVLRGQLAQQREEAGLGRDEAHVGRVGLGEQRGDLVLGERGADGVDVVPGHDHRAARRGLGDAGRRRDALGGEARARLREQAVDVAVVGAGELDERLAAGGRAGEPDRAHRRLGARGRHAQHVDARHALADELGELDLAGRRRAVARAERGGRGDGLDHRRVGVAEDQRAPGADVVDVDVAVDVEDLRALGALDEDRVAADRAHRAHGRVHAARQDAERAPVELRRARVGERGGQDPCSCSQRANASVK